MRKKLSVKKRFVIFSALFLSVTSGLLIDSRLQIPSRINIFEGETLNLRSSLPYTLTAPVATGGILEDNGTISHTSLNSYNAELKLFGVIPVRTISVNVSPQTRLVPCGNTIGIKIFTEGLVCVETSELVSENGKISNPALEYGINTGDIILSVNGAPLKTCEQLALAAKTSDGKPVRLLIKRAEKTFERDFMPVKTDEGYKLGLWVRDSTAGIGTLTFYDENTKLFGALGHPIADSDTGTLMPVSSGTIVTASVFNIKKGVKGEPGELKGIFTGRGNDLGEILKNTNQGIYGSLNLERLKITHESIPLASRSQIKEGAATILSNVDGENIEEFDIEIQRIIKYSNDNCKDMVIKITDPELIEKTGGIVQGMSGSPIIQNGRIVGAVTHVFVNDPTRGYGIFIDNMYSKIKSDAG